MIYYPQSLRICHVYSRRTPEQSLALAQTSATTSISLLFKCRRCVYSLFCCVVIEILPEGFSIWSVVGVQSQETFDHKLADAVITFALVHHVQEVNSYDPNSESFSLDLILTIYEEDVTNLHHIPSQSISDHAVFVIDFHIFVSA